MAYQVLALKWRPKSFQDLKGQEPVTRALINAMSRHQLHHAYLFTGTRGVGKTTIARILAKSLNCEKGVTSSSCGVCAACVEIDKGCFVDVLEVDAASRTKVEDTRELLDNVQYVPTQGRFKIYLIDEVHMLSGHSFNALLKTLEEPPPHVKFILATTDPERIPITVLSRCLRFSLRPISVSDIVSQLTLILHAEKIWFEPAAIQKIAMAAKGSMRDSLSLVEQAIAYCDETITAELVEEMLGISYQRYLPSLLSAVVCAQIKNCLQIVEQMSQCGADFEQVLASLLQAFHAMAISQLLEQAQEDLAFMAHMDVELLSLKTKLTPEEVQLLYQIGLVGQRELRCAPDMRTGFEMTLLRMMVFRPEPIWEKAIPHQISIKEPPKEVRQELPMTVDNPDNQVDTLNWEHIVAQLKLSGLCSILVRHCVVLSWNGQRLELALEGSQKACLSPAREMQIQEALSQYFAKPIKLIITPQERVEGTPMMKTIKVHNERQQEIQKALEQDKELQHMISTFGATVEKITAIE